MCSLVMNQAAKVRTELLICPHCHGELVQKEATVVCSGCSRVYPINDGVVCFSATDPFYDQYLTEHCPYVLSPKGLKASVLKFLPFWSWREWRFWRSVVPQCERLLDIGCGRGHEIFTEKARETVGFDVALSIVRECARNYDQAVQSSLPYFPFQPASFDVVVSAHVIGHIPLEHKDVLVSEIARVLRPGGVTAHIIETDSQHAIVAAAKGNPELYQKQFINQDGHVGLELADKVVDRFTAHGFRLKKMYVVDAIVPSLQNYRKYLSHPGFADFEGMANLRRLNAVVTANRVANAAYEVGMGTFHRTVEQFYGNPQKAQFILVAFQKGD